MQNKNVVVEGSYFNKPLDHKEIEELVKILYCKPEELSCCINVDSQINFAPKNCSLNCNEVYPNLFISDASTATNKDFLRTVGITHVLNTAEGDRIGMVNTNNEFYGDVGVSYLGLQLMDLPITPIFRYFQQAADFIAEGLNSGGKVLVHCLMGISRSSTCAIAYLMIKKKMSVEDAVRQIKAHRHIRPNDGFLYQLLELNRQLRSGTNT